MHLKVWRDSELTQAEAQGGKAVPLPVNFVLQAPVLSVSQPELLHEAINLL